MKSWIRRNPALLAVMMLWIMFFSVIILAVNYRATIRNRADIRTVNVSAWEDANMTVPLTEIDWGILVPGETKNFSAYVLSISNVPVVLNMTVGNWLPENASDWIACTWNREGATLAVNANTTFTVTLSVSANITNISHFEFDIVLEGL